MLGKYSAGRVIGADTAPFRLRRAKELGADEVVDVSEAHPVEALNALTDSEMADIVVVGPNSLEALQTGLKCAAPGGSVLMFTPARPGETLTIDPNEIYFRDISLIPSYSAGPADTADALELIEEGVVRAETLVTHRFGIEEADKAYRLTAEAGDSLKCLVVF